MGFEASGVVKPLDFTFKPYTSVEGTIAEPSDAQVSTFIDGLKNLAGSLKEELPDDIDMANPLSLISAMENLQGSAVVEISAKMAEVTAALCSGKPSAADIMKLPLRVRSKFFEWLQTEVMSPEAVPAAGISQVTPLRRAAGG